MHCAGLDENELREMRFAIKIRRRYEYYLMEKAFLIGESKVNGNDNARAKTVQQPDAYKENSNAKL